jgi:hypothetical protein
MSDTGNNFLILPDGWGILTDEQAKNHEYRYFHCGICSDGSNKVFHNTWGNHRHIEKEVLARLVGGENTRKFNECQSRFV